MSLFVTVRLQRPAFMVWVKKALLFKGQEKAALGDLRLAVDELTSHTTEAWASGLLPTVQRPCMLAYAAAGSRIQVSLSMQPFCGFLLLHLLMHVCGALYVSTDRHTYVQLIRCLRLPVAS